MEPEMLGNDTPINNSIVLGLLPNKTQNAQQDSKLKKKLIFFTSH
jgi:hypothetical protein